MGKPVGLYAIEQTTKHAPYTVARNYLVDLFVGYPERFGYTDQLTGNVLSMNAVDLLGPVSSVVERGFNYEACSRGIHFNRRVAESFHVTAPEQTDWFVIDLDNHEPTTESTKIHLELVEQICRSLPDLHRAVRAKSSFFQYRQIEPTGIQLWVVLRGKQNRANLHNNVRRFLTGLGDVLDERLRSVGLAGLADIEIKPTSTFISMVGAYGKEVFTTERLRITDKRFDCIGLHKHITSGQQAGDVLKRYSELVCVREMVCSRQLSVVAPRPSMPTEKLSWAERKNIALNGVAVPDKLHERYLKPLAQALLLRELWSREDKQNAAYEAIRSWIMLKHNGCVSRIERGQSHLVENQIRSTIKGVLRNTPPGILAHYEKMRENDSRFPGRVESLLPLMQAPPNTCPLLLIDCKAGVSSSGKVSSVSGKQGLPALLKLPKSVSGRLRLYVRACVRKGRMSSRLYRFAHLLVSDIGSSGKKEINEARLHLLAGKKPGSDPTYLRAWKKHLVSAGVLKPGWQRNIIRGVRSSRYELTDWMMNELWGSAASPAEAPGRPLEGRNKSGPSPESNKNKKGV
jgi:hypothetical protein